MLFIRITQIHAHWHSSDNYIRINNRTLKCHVFVKYLICSQDTETSESIYAEIFIDRLLYDGNTEPELVSFEREQLWSL